MIRALDESRNAFSRAIEVTAKRLNEAAKGCARRAPPGSIPRMHLDIPRGRRTLSIRLTVPAVSLPYPQPLPDIELAERNGGLYLPVDTQNELMDALEKTLGCPMVTKNFRGEGR